jgi:hypothetical protein
VTALPLFTVKCRRAGMPKTSYVHEHVRDFEAARESADRWYRGGGWGGWGDELRVYVVNEAGRVVYVAGEVEL